jgi:hypothetical protein
MASEILNCDIGKINDYFANTDLELMLKERKKSGISNNDSDLKLSDDHMDKKEDEEHKEIEHHEEAEQHETHQHEEIKSVNELSSAEPVNINEYDPLQKSKIELLDYLLNFIDTDGELNYVLAGYFSKFFIHLMNKHPQRVVLLNFRL